MGYQYVGQGVALVEVDTVLVPQIKLPLQKTVGGLRTFGDLNLHLSDNRTVAVKTSGLIVGTKLESIASILDRTSKVRKIMRQNKLNF